MRAIAQQRVHCKSHLPRRVSWVAAVAVWVIGHLQPAFPAETPQNVLPEIRKTPGFFDTLLRQWRASEETGDVPVPDPSPGSPGVRDLSLREAIEMALRNNPGIKVERMNPLLAREDIRKADAVFDPVFSLSSSTERHNLPTAFALSGTGGFLIRHDRRADLTLKKTLRTGGDLSVSLSNERLVSNSDFQLLSPELGSHLKVSLDQPLLRSFGLKFAVILVKVAENSHGVSVLDLHGKLSDLAQRVTEAYWDVALLKESVEAERKGLKLADEIQRQNAVRLRVGRIARVELKEAEAEVANRQAGLIVAENALELARENLRQLVHLEGERTLVPTTIEPIDSLEASTYRGSREVSLKTALEERAELRKARLEVKNRRALLQYSENQLLPSLTLEMSYGQNGLSGRPRKLRPNQPPSNAELFRGKFQDALSDALSNDFREFFTGLKLEIPFDNAAAKSAYARAHVEALQAEASYREQVSQVTIEVRKAHADVEAGGKRVDVTRLARELAGEKLADQEKRFQAGLATTRDMLRYQEDLTKARVAEMKALVDYNRSLSSLRRAEGTLLAHHKIEIIPDTLGAKPWWARF